MDYYKLLNLHRAATHAEIKKAYRILALKFHPDRHNSSNLSKSEAEEKFKLITQAYQVLTDEARRREYDEHNGIGDHMIRDALKRHQQWNPQPTYRKNHIRRHGRQGYHNYENDIDHTKFDVKKWKTTHYGEHIDQLDAENIRKSFSHEASTQSSARLHNADAHQKPDGSNPNARPDNRHGKTDGDKQRGQDADSGGCVIN